MDVSVVICTFDRAALLERTLKSVTELRVPEGIEWELIVVNNNCTDRTDEVIDQFSSRLPIRRVFESRQGLSNARNAGAGRASGDLVIFTDDDVQLAPVWLSAYLEAAARWPEAAYFGGPIEPWFESTPPTWVSNNLDLLGGMLGIRDFGSSEGPLPKQMDPFGANMAFRRRVLGGTPFDPGLGIVGRAWAGGEETLMFEQLRRQGFHGIAVPAAKVRHFVSDKNMSRTHLWNWAFGWGRSAVRMGSMRGQSRTSRPVWRLHLDCIRQYVRYAGNSVLRRDDWVGAFYTLASVRGMIAELRQRDAARLNQRRPLGEVS